MNVRCAGSAYVQVGLGTDGNSAIVYADFEQTNGANVNVITGQQTGLNATAANFQTWISTAGTDGFGVLVRG